MITVLQADESIVSMNIKRTVVVFKNFFKRILDSLGTILEIIYIIVGRINVPHEHLVTHLLQKTLDTFISFTIGGSDIFWLDTNDVFDSFFSSTDFIDNIFI